MSAFSDLTAPARSEFWALLALRHAQGIGPLRAKRLWEAFGSGLAAAEACLTDPAAWADRHIVPLSTARKFAAEQWRDPAKLEWAVAKASNASFLHIGDSAYPALLREIPDAPLVLYYRGNTALLQGPCIGVVGARDCTREGLAVSAFFSRALSRAGVSIVSGLAKGIDRAAHLAGLEGPGGSIGVLGTGVDIVYPTCNADLHSLMAEKGLLISEYAPGTPALSKHFPVRNRLISGLSRGALVVEAAGRSGSLVTARLALEQNREVFAVPGHTTAAVSEGCRDLIRRGAKPVFNADDILAELAPLLTLDARAALELRQREGAKKRAQARKRRDEPHKDSLAEALDVLPPGGLPWTAPKGRAPVYRQARKAQLFAEGVYSDDTQPEQKASLTKHHDKPGHDEEQRVLDALSAQPRHIDDIARATGMEVAKLSGLLTFMEIRGLAKHRPGMLYALPDNAE